MLENGLLNANKRIADLHSTVTDMAEELKVVNGSCHNLSSVIDAKNRVIDKTNLLG